MNLKKRKYCVCQSGSNLKNNKKRKAGNADSDEEEDGSSGIKILKNLMTRKIDVVGNHIWFNDDVTNDSIGKLIKIISGLNFSLEQKQREIYFGKIIPKPVYLHINSSGGELQEGMAAVDAIQNSKIPIYTIIEGEAASAATFLSVSGKKRFMTERSVLLIHQLSSGFWGTMQQMEDEHKNNNFFMEKIYSLYSQMTVIPREKLEKIMKRDIWWGVKKAIKYGFVDAIYTNEEDAEKLQVPKLKVEEILED